MAFDEERGVKEGDSEKEFIKYLYPMIDKLAWIEIKNNAILSTRSRGKTAWYIPGGKREQGETDQQALIREIDEELTVSLIENSLTFFGEFSAQAHGHPEGVRVRMRCYTGVYFGEIKAAAEIEEVGWLKYSDRYKISPVDQIIFDYLFEKGMIA